MRSKSFPPAIPKGVRWRLSCVRLPRILHAALLILLLASATPAQSATSPALSPVVVTRTGTLLSAQPALPSVATTGSGALTLSSNAETPDIDSENSIEINNLRISNDDGFAAKYGVTAPSIHLKSSDSGSFAAAFTSWQDETVAFEEVTAVPEPSTWLAAVCILALLIWHQRRRCLSRRAISDRVPTLA